ncbi:MAG: sulfite exporter TauE/SafE family protein, partial [Desulfovibrionaceae bacterium]|nr:sulfite exporter TauE/SafE family protein [Desulfovibrionaceae bacterium]
RAIAVPKYLVKLGIMDVSEGALSIMGSVSFAFMCLALGVGSVIILGAMWKGRRVEVPSRA